MSSGADVSEHRTPKLETEAVEPLATSGRLATLAAGRDPWHGAAYSLRRTSMATSIRICARPILRRGRREGYFRTDVPLDWQVATIQSILHGASAAVHGGEISATLAPTLVVKTVLGALAAP